MLKLDLLEVLSFINYQIKSNQKKQEIESPNSRIFPTYKGLKFTGLITTAMTQYLEHFI